MKDFWKLAATNWQTSLFGVLSFLAILFDQGRLLFDGVPESNPDWNMVAAALGVMLVALRARDSGVSSVHERNALLPRK